MKKIIAIVITVSLLIVGVMGFMSIGQTKTAAKKTLENYLSEMKQGNTDKAYKYLSIDTDSLIDVFDYKYLRTLDEKDIPVKTTMTLEEFEDSSVYKQEYLTFKRYKKHIQEIFGASDDYVVKADQESISYYKKGETIKQYTFLYNMTVANELGNKLYKKVEFTLLWNESAGKHGQFEITDITIR
jgi:uncharacterized protein YqfB (UPF0267 family)